LSKALKEFALAVAANQHPKRVFKPSGIDRQGSRFEPYLRLGLWHHHLGRNGDPLLVLQQRNDRYTGVALARHADYTTGDKLLWLKTHIEAIDWTDCEDLRQTVVDYDPEDARHD
jgi:hypothetical protein